MTTLPNQVRVATIYNPQNQTRAGLIEGFVVRQTTFERLFKEIKGAKMAVPEQHYLLLGPRGIGKTTMLLRLAYEVDNTPKLHNWLIPVIFNEEEYGIRRLFNFWERIMDKLEQHHADFNFAQVERRRLSALYKDDDAYERALYEWLSNELKRTGKKALLLIDNFGDIAEKFSKEEAHRLRKILQESSDIRIIAASAVVLDSFYDYKHPFYEFFKVEELKGLSNKETQDLLLRLSENYKKETVTRIVTQHPGRVEALRRITGGVIRTMVLLFEIFADDEDGNAFKDLEVVLDRISPLYKHRMDDLSTQQQAIVEAIALQWDGITVKEIVENTRLDSKIISAQLQSLEKNGVVEKRATMTKNHVYLVAERFFNIWFLMRLGRRSDEKRVLWLVRFFEDWCDEDMMRSRAKAHRQAVRRGGFDPEAAFSYTQAFAQTEKLSAIEKHELLRDTRDYLTLAAPNLAQDLKTSDLDVAYEGCQLWFKGKKDKALTLLRRCRGLLSLEKASELTQITVNVQQITFWDMEIVTLVSNTALAFATLDTPDFEKAKHCWQCAAEAGDINAMLALGAFYKNERKDLNKAIAWYQKAADLGSANAMFNLGWLYKNEQKDIEKAEYWYEKAAHAGNSKAMNNLGWLYKKERKLLDKAQDWYEKAANIGNVTAMYNLGWLHQNDLRDSDKAQGWYEKAALAGNATAMYNLGRLYKNERNDSEKAKYWYEKSAKLGNALAMNNIAWQYFEEKNKDKAVKWITKGLTRDSNNDWFRHTAACIYAWNNDLPTSKALAVEFLKNEEFLEKEPDYVVTYFLLMLGKGEIKWLLQQFTSSEGEAVHLKDRFKPIYYAVLKQLDHPDFLRMGDELRQTVDEVIQRAQKMGVDYA
jgi:TPR repeat protein/nucleoside-triphosphatase THEP1